MPDPTPLIKVGVPQGQEWETGETFVVSNSASWYPARGGAGELIQLNQCPPCMNVVSVRDRTSRRRVDSRSRPLTKIQCHHQD